MKLKLDENGHVVVQDGRPVYTHDDGKDAPFDAKASLDKIRELNREAQGHRESKEDFERKLKAFDGIENADDARKAIETVRNLSSGELKTNEQVEEIKRQAQRAAEQQVEAAARSNGERIKTLESQLADVTTRYDGEKIANAFANSKFIQDKIGWPADAVQAIFGRNFKHEDGKLVGYDSAGNKMYSRTRAGEVADFDEAVEMAVDAYAHRDAMYKGTQSSGSGHRQSSGNGAGGKTMTRAEFNRVPPMQQSKVISEGTTIVD